MLQIIEKSFNSMEEARKFVNETAIEYKEVKDVDFIYSKNDQYTAILKLDIETKYIAKCTFDLASIVRENYNEIKYDWEDKYKIIFKDDRLKEWESLKTMENNLNCYKDGRYTYILILNFDMKDDIRAIEINGGILQKKEIILKRFDVDRDLEDTEEHFYCKSVDGKMLFTHVLEVYKQRGYIFDRKSLKRLEKSFNRIADTINHGGMNK